VDTFRESSLEIHHDLSSYKSATFISFCSTPIHVATSLEIIQNHLQVNWNYLYWGNQTRWKIGMNLEYRQYGPRFPRELEKALVRIGLKDFQYTSNFKFDSDSVDRRFKVLKPLLDKCIKVEDLKRLDTIIPGVGAAIANAYTLIIRDKYTSIRWNRLLLQRLLISYLEVYEATLKLLETRQTDVVIIYNGRYLHERAVRDACEVSKRKVLMHESTRDKYFLRQEGFHDRIANQRLWSKFWDDSTLPLEDKLQVAYDYFEGLNSRVNPFFTGGVVPEFSNSKSSFVVFFTSNDDETVGFWDIWTEKLGNQFEVIEKLRAIFEEQKDLRLVIRVHPNTRNKPWQVRKKWSRIKPSHSVSVISANSKQSSMELVKNSIGVMTFGSTIGLESAFLGKRVAVLCDANYDMFTFVSKCDSWETLNSWIEGLNYSNATTEEERIDACKRAYFVSHAGVPFLHHEIVLTDWNSWNPSEKAGFELNEGGSLMMFWKICRRIVLFTFRFWHMANSPRGKRPHI
jgi:hypothetical protein